MSNALLLDTHAAIWFAKGTLKQTALDRLVLAGLAGQAFISPVTAWEIGLLTRSGKAGPPALTLLPSAAQWYAQLLAQPLLTETPLTAEILISASHLPGNLHADPADRMLVATARALNCFLMTRDRKIRNYAKAGHVKVTPC